MAEKNEADKTVATEAAKTNAKAVKPMNANCLAAVKAVLDKQKEVKRWDGNCHAAATAILAEGYIKNGTKHGVTERTGTGGLYDELGGSEPWGYASNMKKRLEELELIPKGGAAMGDLL